MIKGLLTHLFVNHQLGSAMLDAIEKSGVDVLEVFCARQHFDYCERGHVHDLAAWFSGSRLRLHSIHAPMYNDTAWGKSGPQSVVSIAATEKIRRIQACEEIKRALEVAEAVPFRYMVLHIGVSREEFDERKWEAAFSSIEHLRMFARQRGVDILLENIPNELSTPDRLLAFIHYTHMNDLGFCFDTGHAHLLGSAGQCFETMKDRVRSTHVHDNLGEKDDHLYPFQGNIGWKRLLADFREARKKHDFPLLLETHELPGVPEPLQEVAAVFRKFEELESEH